MNKFNLVAIAAVAANIASLYISTPLVGFVAAIGFIYLGIYGAIMLGYGLANSFMLLSVEKTLDENTDNEEDSKRYDRNAKCLFAGYACVALLIILMSFSFYGTAIFAGLIMLWVLTLGYSAKRWRG